MRNMASLVGLEDLYRLVYSPTSGELHGEWASLKKHNLTVCSNPLHRYHRLPRLNTPGLVWTGSILGAASILANTVESWLRAYGLESEAADLVAPFRTQIDTAFSELASSQAATA
ncbi:MAG: hypothetical protein QOG23_3070 [Blastocatellia bacterium]|jgi:hypothetical protein|nr:hypothetical protein [Blastocatellia bacterium]